MNVTALRWWGCRKASPPFQSISGPLKRVVVDCTGYGLAVGSASHEGSNIQNKKEKPMPTAIAPKPESETTKTKSRPAAEFRDSNLRVTIWPNQGSDGVTRHNVILSRSYQANGIWKETRYLGRLDLQRAIKLLNRADDWIFNTATRIREIENQAAAA